MEWIIPLAFRVGGDTSAASPLVLQPMSGSITNMINCPWPECLTIPYKVCFFFNRIYTSSIAKKLLQRLKYLLAKHVALFYFLYFNKSYSRKEYYIINYDPDSNHQHRISLDKEYKLCWLQNVFTLIRCVFENSQRKMP